MPTNTNGVLRLRPRINVPRGYTGNEPQSLTRSAPLNSASLDGSAAVYSGQPLVYDGSTREFRKPNSNNGNDMKGANVYFALQDGLDTDVQSCGKITGFSALGDFEIETPWVDHAGTTIAIGDALMLATNVNGVVEELTKHDGVAAELIVGYVTDVRDLGVGGHIGMQENGALVDGDGNPVNVRGGVSGRVPEDSTSAAYDAGDGSGDRMLIVRFRCAAR